MEYKTEISTTLTNRQITWQNLNRHTLELNDTVNQYGHSTETIKNTYFPQNPMKLSPKLIIYQDTKQISTRTGKLR